MKYYLAVDIGASSGRHILGCINKGKIELKEIYRFDNELMNIDGSLYWDISRLEGEVKKGIKICGDMGIIPESIAIDTWGVDYVLFDCRNVGFGKCAVKSINLCSTDKRTLTLRDDLNALCCRICSLVKLTR